MMTRTKPCLSYLVRTRANHASLMVFAGTAGIKDIIRISVLNLLSKRMMHQGRAALLLLLTLLSNLIQMKKEPSLWRMTMILTCLIQVTCKTQKMILTIKMLKRLKPIGLLTMRTRQRVAGTPRSYLGSIGVSIARLSMLTWTWKLLYQMSMLLMLVQAIPMYLEPKSMILDVPNTSPLIAMPLKTSLRSLQSLSVLRTNRVSVQQEWER